MAKGTKIVSKKHLARLERERRQTTAINISAIAIVLAVVLLIGYGILKETVLLSRQPVVTVDGDSVSLKEFQARVRVMRQNYIDQYLQYYQLALMFGLDPTTDSTLSATFDQITSALDTPTTIGQYVVDDIVHDLLIRHYAEANGITVSAQDVEDRIRSTFGFYPDGSPTPTASATLLAYSTLSAEQLAMVSPTPRPTLAPTNTSAPTRTPDLTATVTSTPSITPTATAYTLEGFQTSYQEALARYAKMGYDESMFRRIFFESQIYRERVKAIITADVATTREEVWARHILVADEATANEIYQQLLAGADFTSLAAQYSTDTSNKDKGGDLGWFVKGVMAAEFEAAAFSQEIGVIGAPVQTSFGWHIIQVLGHEMRPLPASDFSDAVDTAFNDWLSNQRNLATVVIDPLWSENIPTTPDLQSAFDDIYATSTAQAETEQVQATP